MTEDNRIANATTELGMARDAVRVAHAALALGIVRDALSRAYYAAFHAARALLLLNGVEPKTHAGVLRMFSEHWIKSRRMPSEEMLVLTRLQAYRLASDYSYSFEVDVAAATAEVLAAERFVSQAQALVATETDP